MNTIKGIQENLDFCIVLSPHFLSITEKSFRLKMLAHTLKLQVCFCLLIILSTPTASCPCGRRRLRNEEKIVGGHLSRQNAWPWTVALIKIENGEASQFCGASLIDSYNVLTAGHCVYDILVKNQPLSNFQVYMGDTKLNSSSIVRYNFQSIKIHPYYNPTTFDNDIAIIRLTKKVLYTESIQPICIHQPNGQRLTARLPAIVAGWGSVRNDGPTVNSQRQVGIRIVPIKACRRNYRQIGVNLTPKNMICAASNNKDSCTGDSGGPLFIKRRQGNLFEQIGIVSFGRECARPGFPGVYTKLNTFKNFIQRNSQAGRC